MTKGNAPYKRSSNSYKKRNKLIKSIKKTQINRSNAHTYANISRNIFSSSTVSPSPGKLSP